MHGDVSTVLLQYSVGMTVNDKKTQVLCISSSVASVGELLHKTNDGSKICGQESLKQLGFLFGRKPNADSHIAELISKYRRRIWIIRHLKEARVPRDDLVALYKCFLLPVLDHSCIVYHTLITNYQSSRLEELQSRTLKIIFGYTDLLEGAGIEHLTECRLRLLDSFILKCAESNLYSERWFPYKEFIGQDLERELKCVSDIIDLLYKFDTLTLILC